MKHSLKPAYQHYSDELKNDLWSMICSLQESPNQGMLNPQKEMAAEMFNKYFETPEESSIVARLMKRLNETKEFTSVRVDGHYTKYLTDTEITILTIYKPEYVETWYYYSFQGHDIPLEDHEKIKAYAIASKLVHSYKKEQEEIKKTERMQEIMDNLSDL